VGGERTGLVHSGPVFSSCLYLISCSCDLEGERVPSSFPSLPLTGRGGRREKGSNPLFYRHKKNWAKGKKPLPLLKT
jgi:hypothetical protein